MVSNQQQLGEPGKIQRNIDYISNEKLFNEGINASFASRMILSAIVVFMNMNGFLRFGIYGDVVALSFVVATVILGTYDLFHAAILILLLFTNPWFLPNAVLNLPTIPFLFPFLVSLLIVLLIPKARSTLSWIKFGRIDKFSFVLIATTAIVSTAALIGWATWTDNLGSGEKMMASIIHYPRWQIIGIGIPVFALVNAFAEEVIYRGVLQEVLYITFNSVIFSIVFQASMFAAAHVAVGFPNGLLGYIMVFVYGTMLGFLRMRTKGMFAPYLTHVFADLIIGYTLYFYAV
jgi:membrane protease YdiL (CAAX protease family)